MSGAAVHLPGGNRLDDVRLDLPQSYVAQDEWLRTVQKTSARRSRVRNDVRRIAYRGEPYRAREALVNAGLRRAWFEEFRAYWESVLAARPLTLMDFHQLRYEYRKRAHVASAHEVSWASGEQHLANWQQPEQLSQTFEFVYRAALHPAWEGRTLFDVLRPRWRVLEYGCSLAPMYRTWRTFLSHRGAHWTLADLPGFPFHYARWAYAHDAEAEFAVIEDLDDPLHHAEGAFDLVIAQAVFEHLDRPRFVAEYLLDRLAPGGLLWFSYSITDATGLDTPAAMRDRRETLEFLAERLDVVRGELRIDDRSLGTTVGRKR
jgi:SAM-dependent methyltransferase